MQPPSTCNLKECRKRCSASGATGFCQVEIDMTRRCMCQSNPTPGLCDPITCSSGCIATGNGATGGICQTERDGSTKCICSFNPLPPPPPLCDPIACESYCFGIGNEFIIGGQCNGGRCQCIYSG